MKVNDILTKAQVLAGYNDISGHTVDDMFLSFAYQLLDQTLMDVSNDARLAHETIRHDFQHMGYPMQVSYPLPSNCLRVLRAWSGPVELRKTDYSTLQMFLNNTGFANYFAVNAKEIFLANPRQLTMTYVPPIATPQMGQDLAVPDEYLPYIINKVAYKLAITNNNAYIGVCNAAVQESLEQLLSNIRVNSGDSYQSIYTSISRFNPIGMGL